MLKALFLDLDGTISDTHAMALASWIETLRPHGVDLDMDLYKETFRGADSTEAIGGLLPKLSAGQRQDLVDHQHELYRARARRSGPILGLDDLLTKRRDRGLRLALVTNGPRADAEISLDALGLSEVFDTMVFYEDIGRLKPDPALYNSALHRLGIRPDEALAFEDSPKGISAAVAAGVTCVGLHSTHSADELRRAGARLVAGDLADRGIHELVDAMRG